MELLTEAEITAELPAVPAWTRDGNSITVMTSWTKDSLKAMPDYKDERRIPSGSARSGG